MSGALYLSDGTKYTITNGLVQSIRDRNGNLITFQYQPGTTLVSQIQDAAGRVVTVAYNTRVTATETDDTITFPGAQGQSRTIVVTKMFPRDRLRPDLTQPSSLFPELGAAIVGPGPRIARIRLPDNRTYEFYYTPYGELARVVLPTGGTIDYDHGPGLAGAGSIPGAYASGQVLDSLSPLWTVMTGSVPPPPWQPYVYRRLLERREYPDGVGMPSGLVTSFGRVETATGSFTDPVSGRIQSVSLSTSASAAVTRSGPGLAAPVTEFHYYHGEAYGQPVLSSPPIGPAAGLAYSSPRYSPDPFEGKEYKTETAGLLRVERVYVEGANGAGLLCQENTTWLSNNLTSARYMQYDSQFANLTDVYEYDFGAAPAIQTATNGVRTWLACPSSPPANATRRQHKEYLLSSAYTAAPVHVRRLVTREQVISPQGAVVADTKITYDNQSDADCTLTYSLADVMTTLQRDPAYGASLATRGNPRCVSRWRSSSLGWVTVGMSYDTAGNLLQRRDERGNVTTFSYTDQYDIGSPPASTKSLVTSITNPRGHVTRWWYDYGTGKPTRHEDPNAIQTTYSYADPLDRLTSAARGGYETVSFTYQDAQRLVTTRRDLNAANDQLRLKEAVYDGFGRTILVREHEGGGVWAKVETRYDAMGRVWQVSTPYRSSPSAWTVTEYDGLGRPVRVTVPDGAVTLTQYTGPNARVIDAAAKEKTLTRDGLGRLTQVQEGPAPGISTIYSYDLLDNLTTVNQAGQVRTFSYDGIGRLLTAQNPENGTISYTYDASGNLISRTDARSAVTTMTYDELNRLTSKSYTTASPVAPTLAVSYTYDQDLSIAGVTTENRPVGRLVKVANADSETVYRYDGVGRPLASRQTTGSASYVFRYTHVPAGLASTTYPSGRVVTQSYDAAGRVSSVNGMMGSTATQYVTGASYAAHGAVEQMPLGNSRTEQWCYNDRLQPVAIRLGTGTSAGCAMQAGDLLTLGFGYGTTNNNGNVLSQTITRPGFSATQTYTYDAYNRIQKVQDGTEFRDFAYKEPGNLYVPSWSTGAGWAPGSFTPVSPAWFDEKNRLVNPLMGIQYDAAGNLTAIGGFTFAYDAENRLASSTLNSVTTNYVYDGEGRRVKKGSVVMVYDAFGRLAAEYGGTADPVGTEYLTTDPLGSTRLVTSSTGAERRCLDYLPFGEQMTQGMGGRGTCYTSATEPRVKFTGKERDQETGLDYFGARYLSPAQGRFTSPDRLNVTEDRLLTPSNTLNKYVYGANNPLRFVDPDGRDVVALLQPPHGFMPGHFALFAHNPDTGAAAFMSFGPIDTSASGRAMTVLGAPMGSTAYYGMPKSADELRQSYAALSIQTTPEQAQEVIEFINRFSTTENPYRLFETNCSTVCRDALKAIGVLPRNFGRITPFSLWTSLYRRYSNPSLQRFNTTTRYGEQFQSLRIDANRGTDYGNPRFGMNVFDFMMLMLRQQQPKACVEVYDSATGQRSKQCE